jgi:transcriptional regulator
MYVPAHFREERLPVLHDAIKATRLTTLVTFGGDGMEASHLPVLLDEAVAPYGAIRGHLARANPQWSRTDRSVPALAIFLGPDAYISPSWYPAKREHGKVVPTWNYLTVHGYGEIEFFQNAERLLPLVTSLTERHEGPRADPWAVSDAPADYIQAHLKGIVGFELKFSRLEGKWKMSQNRDAADRAGVAAGLEAEGEPAVASIMRDLG